MPSRELLERRQVELAAAQAVAVAAVAARAIGDQDRGDVLGEFQLPIVGRASFLRAYFYSWPTNQPFSTCPCRPRTLFSWRISFFSWRAAEACRRPRSGVQRPGRGLARDGSCVERVIGRSAARARAPTKRKPAVASPAAPSRTNLARRGYCNALDMISPSSFAMERCDRNNPLFRRSPPLTRSHTRGRTSKVYAGIREMRRADSFPAWSRAETSGDDLERNVRRSRGAGDQVGLQQPQAV